MEKELKTEKILKMNGLPSLFCRVRYAHTTKQTPRPKMANAIIWLYPARYSKQETLTENLLKST
jgi:hypothetical protein